MNYKIDIELSKRLAHKMNLKYKAKIVPSKKLYSKKDRERNKINPNFMEENHE